MATLWENYSTWKTENGIEATTPWQEGEWLSRYIYQVYTKRRERPDLYRYPDYAAEVLEITGTPWDAYPEWRWILRQIATELLAIKAYELAHRNNIWIADIAEGWDEPSDRIEAQDKVRNRTMRLINNLGR